MRSSGKGGGGYPNDNARCEWTGRRDGRCADYDWGYQDSRGRWSLLSSRRFNYRNCTDFVAWFMGLTWSSFHFPGNGNAVNWKASAGHAGLQVTSQPSVGDIAWWGGEVAGGYGHVAVVTAVNANKSVTVAEYNGDGRGNYDLRPNMRADAYLHRPTETPPPPKPPPPSPPHNPRGNLDSAYRVAGGMLRVVGWALDDDQPTAPLTVKVLIDGQVAGQTGAGKPRGDVGAHGFDVQLPVDDHAHTISVLAVNAGGGTDAVIAGARAIPATGTDVIGDLNGDGYVGCADKALLIANYGKTGPGLAGDLNGDNTVDVFDLSILLSHWNPPPGEPSCTS